MVPVLVLLVLAGITTWGCFRFAVASQAGLRFTLCTGIGGVAGFGIWCLVDVLTVKVLPYPEHVDDFDWIAFAYPILMLGIAGWALRGRFALAIGATFVACLIAILLILFLGIPLHFAIGGHF